MLCSANGYPYQASIYCGKSDHPEDVGLGQHVVLSFAALVDNKAQHELYFDNFFTSHALLCTLKRSRTKGNWHNSGWQVRRCKLLREESVQEKGAGNL